MPDEKCRAQGCPNWARWHCVIVMPAPPRLVGSTGADRARLRNGVVVCDKHKRTATLKQVLGPFGYQALTSAFRAAGKKAPPVGDLALDFESFDHAPDDPSIH